MDVDILNLFIDSPGNLLYFLAVIGVSQTAFFMALDQRLRHRGESGAGRLALGAAGMTLSWAALMLSALLSMQGQMESNTVLPPLERAVNTWVLLWAGWAFLTVEASDRAARWMHAGLAVLLLLTAAGYLYTALEWRDLAATMPFNESDYALPWTFVPVVVCALGGVLLLLRYRATRDVPLKVVFFAVVAAGYVAALAQITTDSLPGDYAGAVRLGLLAATPVFIAIVYRHVIYRLTPAAADMMPAAIPQPAYPADALVPPIAEFVPAAEVRVAEAATTRIIQAVDSMLSGKDPHQVPEQIALTIATVLQADVVVVASVDDHWADVLAAYDYIQQKSIMGLAINLNDQPTLAQALKAQQQVALLPESRADELTDLYARFDLSGIGAVYFQPIARDGVATGAILVALPYSERRLSEDEQMLLRELAPLAAGVMAMADLVIAARFAAEVANGEILEVPRRVSGSVASATRRELQDAREQIGELNSLVRNLQIELDYQRGRLAAMGVDEEAALSISQQMEVLRVEREELAEERDRLHAALSEAQTTLATATADDQGTVLQAMVEMLTREKEELEAQRDELQNKLEALSDMPADPDTVAEMLNTLTDETARLSAERDQIAAELQNVKGELESLGIEGGTAGLAELLGRLYDERTKLVTQLRQLAADRDRIASEHEGLRAEVADVESQTELRTQVSHLAGDREALTVQRDALRRECDVLANQLEDAHTRLAELEAEYARAAEQIASQESDLQRAVAIGQSLGRERDALNAKVVELEATRDELTAQSVTLAAERDQLRARLTGQEEDLEGLNVEMQSIEALQELVADLGQQRTGLDASLAIAHAEAGDLRAQLEATQARLWDTQMAVETAIDEAVVMRQETLSANVEVVASSAQELRTPMSSIVGYTDLLLSESVGILGAMQRNFLQRIKANIERMCNLLGDLIWVATMDVGQLELAPEPVDAVEVIEEAIMGAGNQFREQGITLRMDLAYDLPPVQADRDSLQQIMTQLLFNACLASPPQSEVLLTARQEEDFVAGPNGNQYKTPCLVVSVSDWGGGVSPNDVERVFNRKYRADNPLIEGLGDTGVGLSIVKTLVEAHGGHIWMESEEGVGSTFTFVLPLEHLNLEET